MYLKPLQENYIEKVVRDPAGRLVRVTFYVYEQNGRIKGRIVDTVVLEEFPSAFENAVLALPPHADGGSVPCKLSSKPHSVVSPYVDTSLLYTLGVQPRAPAVE
jgi:hypothetical protein